MTSSPQILVDADACPVKAEVEKVAERHGVVVTYVSNGGLRPSRDPMIRNVVVSKGADAADDWIVDNARANDIVVTADIPLAARAVVLASGGAGGLYAVTTNPLGARAIAMAAAARAGAVIADAEFVQFHPTALDVGKDPAPLATEALRGDGATLINGKGERFMSAIDKAAELAPRDIVARGVFAEIQAGRGAFLDARGIENFSARFPTVFAACREL